MNLAPNSFPSENNYRSIVFQPDRHTDFEAMHDICADASRALRKAMQLIDTLPHQVLHPLRLHRKILREALDRARVLTPGLRNSVEALIDKFAEPNEDIERLTREQILHHLRVALDRSHRVGDLLAAEQEIARLQGIID